MSERQQRKLKLDQIGYWSEVKLDIIRDYAKAYSASTLGVDVRCFVKELSKEVPGNG